MSKDDNADDDLFPEAPASMRGLDEMLRCPICGEHFETALMFPSCSHNYCSLCIRRSLEFKEECPTCRKKAIPSDLIPNRVLDGVVSKYKRVTLDVKNIFQSLSQPKQRVQSPPSCLITNTLTKPPSNLLSPAGRTKEVHEIDDDDDFIPEFQDKPKTASKSISSTKQKEDTNDRATVLSSDLLQITNKKVTCPSCLTEVNETFINTHLDRCLASNKAKEAPSMVMTKEQRSDLKPLQKYFISQMSEKAIREALKEHGLPTKGDKIVITQRLKEFILLYNSQRDSPKPMSKQEIVSQVMRDERLRQEKPTIPKSVSSGVKSKSFEALTREIRERRPLKTSKSEDVKSKSLAELCHEPASKTQLSDIESENNSDLFEVTPIQKPKSIADELSKDVIGKAIDSFPEPSRTDVEKTDAMEPVISELEEANPITEAHNVAPAESNAEVNPDFIRDLESFPFEFFSDISTDHTTNPNCPSVLSDVCDLSASIGIEAKANHLNHQSEGVVCDSAQQAESGTHNPRNESELKPTSSSDYEGDHIYDDSLNLRENGMGVSYQRKEGLLAQPNETPFTSKDSSKEDQVIKPQEDVQYLQQQTTLVIATTTNGEDMPLENIGDTRQSDQNPKVSGDDIALPAGEKRHSAGNESGRSPSSRKKPKYIPLEFK